MTEFFKVIRKILNALHYIAGGAAIFFGVLLLSSYNIFDGFMLVFIGLYLFYARKLVYSVKEKREKLGKIRHDLLLAAIRAPITAFNLMMLYLVFAVHAPLQSVLLIWILLLAAWSVIPLNMLIDLLEKKICS